MKKIFSLIIFLLIASVAQAAPEFTRKASTATRIQVEFRHATTGALITTGTAACFCKTFVDGTSPADVTTACGTAAPVQVGTTGIWYQPLTSGEVGTDYSVVRCTNDAASAMPFVASITALPGGANVTQWAGTAVATPATAGYPAVTIKDGTGTGEIDTNAGAVVAVTTTTTATTCTTATTATTCTNLTNMPTIPANWITAAGIANDAIGATEVADGAIDALTLATDTITAAKIAADAIGASEVATDAIGALELAADSIGASEVATDAIGSLELAASAIGASEFAQAAADTVWASTTRQLTGTQTFNLTGNVTGNLSGSVGSVTGSVGSLGAGSITTATFGAGAIDAAAIAPDAIGASEIGTAAIGSAELGDTIIVDLTGSLSGSVGSVSGSVGSVTGSVGSVAGAVGSVTGSVGSVTGAVGSVGAGGITTASFGAGAIDASAIATDAIGAAELNSTALAEFLTVNTGATSASAVQGSVAQEVADLISIGSSVTIAAGGLTAASLGADVIGHTDTAQAVTVTTLQMAAAETYGTNALANHNAILITNATNGLWEVRCIKSNVAATDTVTFSEPLKILPTGTVKYAVLPTPNCNTAAWPSSH